MGGETRNSYVQGKVPGVHMVPAGSPRDRKDFREVREEAVGHFSIKIGNSLCESPEVGI